MPEATGYSSADVYVDDEERTVDTKIKDRIVSLRKEIDDWSADLFTKEKLGEIDHTTAVSIWGDRVRTYLMAVEPLLWNTDLDNAKKVYHNEKLGIIKIDPPRDLVEATKDRRSRSGDIEILEGASVKPKNAVIMGLKDVIELESVTKEWTVQIRNANAPRGERRVEQTFSRTEPINKTTLRNAVRTADEWLQRNGIGVHFDVEDYRSTEPL